MDSIIRVYDRHMNKLAYLQNAYDIGYDLTLNELWTSRFTLPAEDAKNAYCEPFNIVEIFDGNQRIELFRIMPSKLKRNTKGDIVYECEHVLATLLDDVMFLYHHAGGVTSNTAQVIRYVIDQQLDKKWQLGVCEFTRKFEYKWENENLLAALFSIPQPFDEKYRWEFDTTGTMWRIHLRKLNKQFKADIMYKKNMLDIEKTVDPTNIVTRLYCLGYGEGDNQLNIKSVNNDIPYLESNGSSTTWGIKSSILVDRRYENAESLKAYGQSILDELKYPHISYAVEGVDLFRFVPQKHERFIPGDYVRLDDREDGIIEDLPIVRVSKNDVTGNPSAIDIEIANKTKDIAGSISDLQERSRINEVYAQGATNQMIIPYADNADNRNPSVIRVYIPETMVRINRCILNFRLEPFRAYSKAIGGGGGGGVTSSGGGGGSTTTVAGGGESSSTDSNRSIIETTHGAGDVEQGFELTQEAQGHRHNYWHVRYHTHRLEIPSHSHRFIVPEHWHRLYLDDHTHRINLQDHVHELEFGIYRGERASEVTIKVDGKTVPNPKPNTDINIVDYLSVDGGGRIRRNTWHEIEITPNRMSRIDANVFMQIFTNSRGGGDY